MPINAKLPLPRRMLFRLRNILLIVMLTILGLPLGGLYFFRLYENGLVQQTELELISQAAALSATYRELVRTEVPDNSYGYIQLSNTFNPSPSRYSSLKSAPAYYTPIPATVDLMNPLAPPRPLARVSLHTVDAVAQKIAPRMMRIAQQMQLVTLSGVRLLDMNGTVIMGREEVGLSLAHVPEVQRALKGQYASVLRLRVSDEPAPPLYSISRGTTVRIFVAFPIVDNGRLQGVVYVSRTPTNILQHLYVVKEKALIASLSLLVVAVLLVLFVSSTISRPIRELLKQTERVRQGEQQIVEPLKHPVTHELAQLSDSFAGMSQALAERSDYIRRFATHVSHEFKTPLTAMQGALELLQDHVDTMPTTQREKFITNLLADTQRLKQLVTRLLELARADAMSPVRQNSYLTSVVNPLLNRYQERGLNIVLSQPLPDVALAIAPDALESVICNLLDNSLQHGATQTMLTAKVVSKTLEWRLHDNGDGVSEANRDKIFTPFFTTKRSLGGTGLGLEIIVSILRAYGGVIELGSATQGAEFIVSVPLDTLQLSSN